MPTLLWLLATAIPVVGCASGMQCQRSSDPLEVQDCRTTGSPAEAVGTAAAATVAWGAVGCRVNGCNLPYACNEETGMCERLHCSEGRPCPAPFECDLVRRRCR